jgi:hypothetical protein
LVPVSATGVLTRPTRRRRAGRSLPPAPVEGLPRFPERERAGRKIPPAFICTGPKWPAAILRAGIRPTRFRSVYMQHPNALPKRRPLGRHDGGKALAVPGQTDRISEGSIAVSYA